MWTRKTRFVLVSIRIGLFRMPIILPMRCLNEIIEGFLDILTPFRRFSKKAYGYLKMAEGAMKIFKDYEPLDLVDIDVTDSSVHDKPQRVKIKILTR